MRGVVVREHGGPAVLRIAELERPIPGEGELLVRVQAAGVNFADVQLRRGLFPPASGLPFTPGVEVAGVVSEVGPGAVSWSEGDRVVASLYPSTGGYAEYAVVRADAALAVPPELDLGVSTALFTQGLTAWVLLDHAQMREGATVLVHSAAGGVGVLLCQLAKLRGASMVIGATSSEEKAARVLDFGATHAVDYTAPGWTDRVRELTGGAGVDWLFDAVGGQIRDEGLSVLASLGRGVMYGFSSGTPTGLTAEQLMTVAMSSQTVQGFSLFSWMAAVPGGVSAAWEGLVQEHLEGRLQVPIRSLPLDQAATAHDELESRRSVGKLVLSA